MCPAPPRLVCPSHTPARSCRPPQTPWGPHGLLPRLARCAPASRLPTDACGFSPACLRRGLGPRLAARWRGRNPLVVVDTTRTLGQDTFPICCGAASRRSRRAARPLVWSGGGAHTTARRFCACAKRPEVSSLECGAPTSYPAPPLTPARCAGSPLVPCRPPLCPAPGAPVRQRGALAFVCFHPATPVAPSASTPGICGPSLRATAAQLRPAPSPLALLQPRISGHRGACPPAPATRKLWPTNPGAAPFVRTPVFRQPAAAVGHLGDFVTRPALCFPRHHHGAGRGPAARPCGRRPRGACTRARPPPRSAPLCSEPAGRGAPPPGARRLHLPPPTLALLPTSARPTHTTRCDTPPGGCFPRGRGSAHGREAVQTAH